MEFESVYDLAIHYANLYRELPYPKMPVLPPQPKREDFPNNASYGKALDEWEEIEHKEKENFRRLRSEWQELANQNEDDFRNALLKYLGISKHKKASKIYEMAWEDGHSSGYAEVAQIAERLVELIR